MKKRVFILLPLLLLFLLGLGLVAYPIDKQPLHRDGINPRYTRNTKRLSRKQTAEK